ncbi:hypothetical protein GPL26_17675 [Enterocloster citroniae]|uniref:Uncharacterized protein n=1 Tax=Enterocloster citroniae TaxID=358743 RepID=A0AA41K7C5_9FIRM|nr:hypothetical protein [Enterocloster citroniae]MBT9811452.1 hypothetical protein [Enterocloster citroniae]
MDPNKGNTAQGYCSDPRYPSHKNTVNNIVKHTDKLCDNHGNRGPYHQLSDITL